LEFILGVGLRRKPSDDPSLALVTAVDHVDVVPLAAGI
jgi:hypothetical protein